MGKGEQAARRAFIRGHHPDRGGDPADFMAGLQRFDAQAAGVGPRVVAVRHRAWPVRLFLAVGRWLGRDPRLPRVR